MTDAIVERLRAAGCVAAEDEAAELRAAARDDLHLGELLARRIAGEPLAWVTGAVTFCGIDLVIHPGVYVPRWQTEAVARAAAGCHAGGWAIDLCTGAGAVAAVLEAHRSGPVIASDRDERAVACAEANGVRAMHGDLFDPLPTDIRGQVDVVVAVPPYVPTSIASVMRTSEPAMAIDGGPDGLSVVRRIVAEAPVWLRRGGSLVVELGRPQVHTVTGELALAGFTDTRVLHDPDGDVCGVVARFQRGA